MNPYFTQNSDFEPQMADPFANEKKILGSHWSRANLRGTFSDSRVHWQMAQPLRGSWFLFFRFTQVPTFSETMMLIQKSHNLSVFFSYQKLEYSELLWVLQQMYLQCM